MPTTDTDSNITMRDMEIFYDIQNFIRRKINNTDGSYFEMWPQKKEVFELIKRSVENSESNTAIICGSPGSGKTALVDNVLEQLAKENIINEDTAFVIKLNGLLHTDDRLALQDIIRQLKVAEGFEPVASASFQENLAHVLEKLKERKKEGIMQPTIIFVLDDFHLFCSHKNQILLYNLFDIAQSAKTPVCVLGMTFYTDIMDLLEKRVLSRFSHRIIWLNQNISVESRLNMFKQIFTLKPDDLPNVDEIYKVLWNLRTDELVENKDVIEAFKVQLDVDHNQTKFRNILFKLFNTVSFELPLLTAENVRHMLSPVDYHLLILRSLSILETCLVLSIKHCSVNSGREPFNFEIIYCQYLKFCKKNSTTLITERSVVLKAFQRLQELEIVVPVRKNGGNSAGKVPLEYQLYNLNLMEEQISEGVKLNPDLTTELSHWIAYSS